MKYNISVETTNTISTETKYNRIESFASNYNKEINFNSIASAISYKEVFPFIRDASKNVKKYYSFKEEEKFIFKLFVNQRKVYRYSKALSELENGNISEEEFENIENSCTLMTVSDDTNLIKDKLLYFYELLNEYSPEEIEFMNNEDIAELISISEHKLNNLEYKLANART